jgi:hypothetical protein
VPRRPSNPRSRPRMITRRWMTMPRSDNPFQAGPAQVGPKGER